MAIPRRPQGILQLLCAWLFAFASLASALKFDLHAGQPQRCIRSFVAKDTLVVVTATIGGHRGDGMIVNMHVKDAVGNDYGRPRDVAGEQRILFTSHENSAFDVCFENLYSGGTDGWPLFLSSFYPNTISRSLGTSGSNIL